MTQDKPMTHWKTLTNPDYIGAYDFQPKEERTLTIKSVANEIVTGPDGKKSTCIVIRWNESNQKPMICNRTNAKTISKVIGTPLIELWANQKVTLTTESVKAFGEVVDAIRIKPVKPEASKVKPQLVLNSEAYDKAAEWLKANPTGIKTIESKYELSNEVYAALDALTIQS
jgi:hypothetical protein